VHVTDKLVACVWARELGLPIGDIVLAHNANRTVPDFLETGEWQPRPSITTLATAMDVGNPSNMERLNSLYGDHTRMKTRIRAVSVDDEAIAATIRSEFERSGLTLCPHSAVGARSYRMMKPQERRGAHWVLAATAHPAKFPEIVEPLIGERIAPPAALARVLGREADYQEIEVTYANFKEQLLATGNRLDYT
jgi:threonine synthase